MQPLPPYIQAGNRTWLPAAPEGKKKTSVGQAVVVQMHPLFPCATLELFSRFAADPMGRRRRERRKGQSTASAFFSRKEESESRAN